MSGGRSDYLEAAQSDEALGGVAFAAPANVYIALFTVTPLDDGTGGTECSAGNYARVAVVNNAVNWPATVASQKKNGVAFAFPAVAGADWATLLAPVVCGGIYDALAAGNLLYYFELLSGEVPFTAAAATDLLTAPGHAFVNGDTVRVTALPGEPLPTGLAARTTYYVVGVAGVTFQLALTSGGAAINLTADGSGKVGKLAAQPALIGNTVSFPVNSIVINLD